MRSRSETCTIRSSDEPQIRSTSAGGCSRDQHPRVEDARSGRRARLDRRAASRRPTGPISRASQGLWSVPTAWWWVIVAPASIIASEAAALAASHCAQRVVALLGGDGEVERAAGLVDVGDVAEHQRCPRRARSRARPSPRRTPGRGWTRTSPSRASRRARRRRASSRAGRARGTGPRPRPGRAPRRAACRRGRSSTALTAARWSRDRRRPRSRRSSGSRRSRSPPTSDWLARLIAVSVSSESRSTVGSRPAWARWRIAAGALGERAERHPS